MIWSLLCCLVSYRTKCIEEFFFNSTICESIPSEWEEVHSESKDCNSKKNTGSIVPTTASIQRTISRLHITGMGRFVGDNFPNDFVMLVVLNPSVILTLNLFLAWFQYLREVQV